MKYILLLLLPFTLMACQATTEPETIEESTLSKNIECQSLLSKTRNQMRINNSEIEEISYSIESIFYSSKQDSCLFVYTEHTSADSTKYPLGLWRHYLIDAFTYQSIEVSEDNEMMITFMNKVVDEYK